MIDNMETQNSILIDINDFLRKSNSILFTFAQDMVNPVFSSDIDTACVRFDISKDKCINFLVNKDFWDKLNYNEKIAIFIHETLHVLFSHGKRGKQFLESLPEDQRSYELLNICMDICINEIIMDQYLSDIPLSTMPTISRGCFVDTVFKDVDKVSDIVVEKGKSFKYYYQTFIDIYGKEMVEKLNFLATEHYFIGSSSEDLDEVSERIDSIFGSDNDDSEKKDLEKDVLPSSSKSYSINSFSGSGSTVVEYKKPETSLEKHLNLMISTSFEKGRPKYKNQWYGINRRTNGVLKNTGMFLPVRKEVKKERKHKLLVYGDVSGSCASVTSKFLSLVSDLDKDTYEFELYVFADRVGKCKINGTKIVRPSVGFGTNITQVLNHYKSVIHHNYDAVLVLTDGYYGSLYNINNKIYDNWHFFIIDDGLQNHPINSKCYNI